LAKNDYSPIRFRRFCRHFRLWVADLQWRPATAAAANDGLLHWQHCQRRRSSRSNKAEV